MILKEWSDAQEIYNAALDRYYKAIRKIWYPSKIKSYRYLWIAYLAVVLPPICFCLLHLLGRWGWINMGFWWWIQLVMIFVPFGFAPRMVAATERAQSQEFAEDDATHAISRYPSGRRDTYRIYAMFLHELKARGYTDKKVADLSHFAEIATPPQEVPLRLFQHPLIFITLMAIFMPLAVEFVKTSGVLRDRDTASDILGYGAMGLLIVLVALAVWQTVSNNAQNRHQIIQRYLQWAKHDMKEEAFS